jgi:uncharacterized membrane protein
MFNLVAALSGFIALHVGVAGTRLRGALIGTWGERRYHAAFTLASILGLAWLVWAFGLARGGEQNLYLWAPSLAWRRCGQGLALTGGILAVSGVLSPGPTPFERTPIMPESARGALRITRRPLLWGVVLWGVGHLCENGDLAGVLLFGGLTGMTLFGLRSMDRKTALREGWPAYAAVTSNVPFAAIVQRRSSLAVRELWWRAAIGLVLALGVIWLHARIIGVPAVP